MFLSITLEQSEIKHGEAAMEEEIDAPKGSILAQLAEQDLSLQGVEELTARIGLLKEEIGRAEAMLESKKGSRNDAEALFK